VAKVRPPHGSEYRIENRRTHLNLLAKKFNDDIANHSGNDGDRKISEGENIIQGKSEALSLTVCAGKFTHQKVGIE